MLSKLLSIKDKTEIIKLKRKKKNDFSLLSAPPFRYYQKIYFKYISYIYDK